MEVLTFSFVANKEFPIEMSVARYRVYNKLTIILYNYNKSQIKILLIMGYKFTQLFKKVHSFIFS